MLNDSVESQLHAQEPQEKKVLVTISQLVAIFMAALTLWREGRGEPKDAKRMIFHTIKTRAGGDPNLIPAVVLKKRQFSAFDYRDPNAILFPWSPGIGAADQEAWLECLDVIGEEWDLTLTEPPTHYYALQGMHNGQPPAWAASMKVLEKIGHTIFLTDNKEETA